MHYYFLLAVVLYFSLVFELAFSTPTNDEFVPISDQSKGKDTATVQENAKIENNMPKLRILIMTWRTAVSESHYIYHRKLAELLVADTENVEKVLLLVFNSDIANQSSEEPVEYGGRLLVWTRTRIARVDKTAKKMINFLDNWSVWKDTSGMFLPIANIAETSQLDFLLDYPQLIEQLQTFKFNVGIMETREFSMGIFRVLSTIKKYVIAFNMAPTIAHWKFYGYEKIVGAMPGRDLARIGDHKYATENAIKENPTYFRERNENLFIKPLESSSLLLHAKYKEAIKNFTIWDMMKRVDLWLANAQPLLDFPIVEQEIEKANLKGQKKRVVHFIGGITTPTGAVPKLNADTKQIFESANSENGGVVLLSFGSIVQMNDDEAHAVAFKNIVLDVFKQYPQMNMIIKWGKQTPIGTGEQYKMLADNVYAKGWLEQSAILETRPKLFITHGGQNSIIEAIKFGVPIILFPFFGDHYNCSEAMAARGVAKVLDIRSKTLAKNLAEAINDIFANYPIYKQKIDELNKKLNPIDPAKDFLDAFRQLRKSL
ncbi:hypothetical protein niasHS_013729 [Heterodera schachtii]|uniref:glucuronosyltransferase n=1 Tax=Heterodera schachtii TaxID=97005 RepID=A0ABD2ITB4_HETSC